MERTSAVRRALGDQGDRSATHRRVVTHEAIASPLGALRPTELLTQAKLGQRRVDRRPPIAGKVRQTQPATDLDHRGGPWVESSGAVRRFYALLDGRPIGRRCVATLVPEVAPRDGQPSNPDLLTNWPKLRCRAKTSSRSPP
jgi:hypothetical protein